MIIMSEDHVFDNAVEELKGKGLATKEDVAFATDSLRKIIDSNDTIDTNALYDTMLNHLKNCADKNCKIHQTKNDLQNQSWARGFTLGVAFGKKRS